jgi:hypothetical protein
VRFLLYRKCMFCSLGTLCSLIFMRLSRFLFFALFSVVCVLCLILGHYNNQLVKSICRLARHQHLLVHLCLRPSLLARAETIICPLHFCSDCTSCLYEQNPSKVCSVLTWNDCTVEHSAPYFYIWWMLRRVERSARSSSSPK